VDMNVALIVRLVDRLSKPLDAMVGKVEGFRSHVAKAASQFGRGFGDAIRPQFSGEQFEKNLDRLDRRVDHTRQHLFGAAAMIATVFAPLNKQADFQDKFIDFANVAEIPVERMGEIERQLMALTKDTGKNKLELLEIVQAYVGKGMDMEAALDAVKATGRSSTAERAAVGDMANAGFAVIDNLGVAAANLQKAFDVMAASGKEGSFELKDMARSFPELTANAQALQMRGVPAVAALSAALQIAMKSAGSADEAANNMSNFLGKISSPDTVKNFKKMGIDIEAEMKGAAKNGTDPLLHAMKVIKKATGGDQYEMGKLFADKEVLNFLRAMMPNLEEYERIRDKAASSEGVIDRDFANVAKGLRTELKGLVTEIDNLFASTGALLPAAQAVIRWLTGAVRAVNDWTNANPELTSTIVQAAGAMLMMGAAMRVLAFAWAVTGRQIFRTIGMFYRFDQAGKSIAPLAGLVGRLGRAFGAVLRAGLGLGRIGVVFTALRTVAAAALGAMASLSAPAIAAMLAIAGAAVLVWKYWQRIAAFAKGLGAGLWDALAPDLGWIGSAWTSLLGMLRGFAGKIASTLGADAEAAMAALGQAFDFSGLATTMLAGLSSLKSSVAGFFAGIFSQEQLSGDARAQIEALGRDLGSRIGHAFDGIDLSGAAGAIIASFKRGFIDAWAGVEAWIAEKAAWLKNAFSFEISLPKLPGWLGGEQAPSNSAPQPVGQQPHQAPSSSTPQPFGPPPAQSEAFDKGLRELGGIMSGFTDAGGRLESAGRQAGGSLEAGAGAAGERLQTAGQSAGTAMGTAAATQIKGAASAAGAAFGAAAAAAIRSAAANIRVTSSGGGARRPVTAARMNALHDGVDE